MSEKTKALPADNRREGNIEWLRIVCMLLIMGHHMAWHGMSMRSPVWTNQVIATFQFAGGMTGVNCFVLITGYFLTGFKARRAASILLQTLFYSLGLTLLTHFTGWRQDVTEETIRNSIFVISRSPYWFVIMYLALTASLPLLQPAVKALPRRAHACFLLAATAYLSVIPTFTFQNPSSQFFHQLTWFYYLYVLGAYFRKYPSRVTRCLPLQGFLFLLSLTAIALLCLWGNDHQDLFQRVGSRQNFFADKNTLPQLICSCSLFLFFANLRLKPRKLLTVLSAASFGAYLIHDHSLLRSLIWSNILHVWQLCQQDDFLLWALLIPPALYLSCAAIDIIRKYVLEKPLFRFIGPPLDRLDRWLSEK